MEIKAKSRFVRTAPDKIRIFLPILRRKKIDWALSQLANISKDAAKPLILLLKQSLAQAKEKGLEVDNLLIKEIFVDEGPKLKRRRILHRGRATPFLKRRSHITVVIAEEEKKEKDKIKKGKNHGS